MLVDVLGREIYYLRVSVTDRCNFRCIYCMPPEGIESKHHDQMLRYEDIARIAKEAGILGFYKIRLTGGEPLVKKNIEECVRMIANCGYYRDICITTNGSLLTKEKAYQLKDAGLTRLTISLDTLDYAKFKMLTRGGNLNDVLSGIDAVNNAGFTNTKINMVVFENTDSSEISTMRQFCIEKSVTLQLISKFSLSNRTDILQSEIVSDRPPKCTKCNRIRITADGYVKSCLFSDNELKIDLKDIQSSLKLAVQTKPENGISCSSRAMSQIGG